MYAILETGGKQYKVREGDRLRVEKLEIPEESAIEFDRILLVDTGLDVLVGSPIVQGAKAVGKVLQHGKGEKIIVGKYKPKKGYRRKTGHRQQYTEVRIEKIVTP